MSLTTIKAVRSETPRARALRALRGLIESGQLPPGEALPSERALASQLSVSRTTLRWALSALAEEGLIGQAGAKTRIAARPPATVLSDAIVVLSDRPVQVADDYHDPALMGLSQATVHGALQSVTDYGYHIFLLHPGNLTDSVVQRVLGGRPRGVVFPWLPFKQYDHLVQTVHRSGMPVVVYGDREELEGLDRVYTDHEHGAYLLTRWLLERGRRRIAFTWKDPSIDYWYTSRRAGYERAMREAGLEPLPSVLFKNYNAATPESAEAFEMQARSLVAHLVDRLICPEPIDAILVPSDGNAYAVAAACRLCGRVPGEDVLIAGYDNYWDQCPERQYEPSIPAVTIDKRNFEMGQSLVALLEDRIAGRLEDQPVCRLVQPYLVVPGS